MLSAEKRRSLEPSAHVVSKVNSILFKLDQGPASSLLLDSAGNDGHDDVVWNEEAFLGSPSQQREEEHPPPPTAEIRFPNPAIADYHFNSANTAIGQGVSPFYHPPDRSNNAITSSPRSVHFDSSMATSYVLDEEIVQLRHTAAIVAGLQKKLKQTRDELVSERANRKRKEKNLIKLAKELNARAKDNEVHDQKMEELEETVADLEGRLVHKSQTEIPRLQLLLEQKEMALSECLARSERQLGELQQAKQDAAQARQELIELVTSSQKEAVARQSSSTPDQKMVEMEETIDDLEGRLALYQNQELPRLQMLKDQKEMALAECQAALERQRAELEQAKLDAAAARRELMEVITSQQAVADVKIVEMEAIIADLEQQLAHYKNHELPRWQLLLDQKEMALADIQARSDRQSTELQQAKQDAAQVRQELVDLLTSQQSQPRSMATLDDSARDSLHSYSEESEPTVMATPPPPIVMVPPSSGAGVTLIQQVFFYVVALLALSIAFLRSSYVHPSVLDIACAPMPPGSFVPAGQRNHIKNQNEVRTFRAPYWVPDLYKREVFSLLCPGRGQTELHQVNWKVEVLRDGKRVWKGRSRGGFRVEQDKVVLLGRHHDQVVHDVKGPWTL
jgi:hypothetical protein